MGPRMNKREAVKELFDKGVLVTPDILEGLDEGGLGRIVANREKLGVVADKVPRKMPPKNRREFNGGSNGNQDIDKTGVVVVIPGGQGLAKATTEDFLRFFNKRFEIMSNILMKKTDAISINKLGNGGAPAAVIGMIKEILPSGFVIEDPTGEIEVKFNHDKEVFQDQVLAVRGYTRDGKFVGKEVILPDIPLTHPIGSLDASMALSCSAGQTGTDIVCTPEGISAGGETHEISNPGWVMLRKGDKEVRLLVFRPEGNATMEDAVGMLKKRMIPATGISMPRGFDPFIMEDIPDIFWLVSGSNGTKIYKGVTIVSCSGSTAVIDLSTRKVSFQKA